MKGSLIQKNSFGTQIAKIVKWWPALCYGFVESPMLSKVWKGGAFLSLSHSCWTVFELEDYLELTDEVKKISKDGTSGTTLCWRRKGEIGGEKKTVNKVIKSIEANDEGETDADDQEKEKKKNSSEEAEIRTTKGNDTKEKEEEPPTKRQKTLQTDSTTANHDPEAKKTIKNIEQT